MTAEAWLRLQDFLDTDKFGCRHYDGFKNDAANARGIFCSRWRRIFFHIQVQSVLPGKAINGRNKINTTRMKKDSKAENHNKNLAGGSNEQPSMAAAEQTPRDLQPPAPPVSDLVADCGLSANEEEDWPDQTDWSDPSEWGTVAAAEERAMALGQALDYDDLEPEHDAYEQGVYAGQHHSRRRRGGDEDDLHVGEACDRIEAFVRGEISALTLDETDIVVESLRALADKIQK